MCVDLSTIHTTATVDTEEAVDLTAPAEPAAAPLTKVAGESGEAPTTPVADPEPAAPARRKRKRVTSEAGPPRA